MIKNISSTHKWTTKTGCTLIGFAAVALSGSLTAEVENELEELVVSATKFPELASETTAQVDVLDLEKLRKRGIYDVRSALNDSPGVLSLSTAGETGAVGSLLIRGTENSDSQIVVDGIRINDSNGSTSNNFLRGPRLDSFGRVELLKGPQGSMYGGNALGGILFMETPTGSGEQETRIFAEGGQFDTLNSFFSNSGSENDFSWFVGGGYNGTHNDTAGQNFDESNANYRFEWNLAKDVVIGTTLRVIDQRFENDTTSVDHLDSTLGTVYLRSQITDKWKASFVLGHYRQNYDSESTGIILTDVDRTSLTTDHVIELSEKHAFRFGLYAENNDFEAFTKFGVTTFTDVDSSEIRYGSYVGWDWMLIENLITKATIRWEDYAEYGEEVTWNLGAAYQPIDGTRFTTNVGRAYTPPTFLDLFGATPTSFQGNPNLEAQESIGWDIGVEQAFLENHAISLTYFHNHLENAIDRTPLPPTNVTGNSETNGVEIGLNGSFADEFVSYRTAWTHLGKSINGQPQNYANATVEIQATERLALGVGMTYLDDRSFGAVSIQSSVIGRIYANFALTDSVMLHARVENVNNEEYELFNSGFGKTPGSGSAFYTGITATF